MSSAMGARMGLVVAVVVSLLSGCSVIRGLLDPNHDSELNGTWVGKNYYAGETDGNMVSSFDRGDFSLSISPPAGGGEGGQVHVRGTYKTKEVSGSIVKHMDQLCIGDSASGTVYCTYKIEEGVLYLAYGDIPYPDESALSPENGPVFVGTRAGEHLQ